MLALEDRLVFAGILLLGIALYSSVGWPGPVGLLGVILIVVGKWLAEKG